MAIVSSLSRIIHDNSSRNAALARDKREERDSRFSRQARPSRMRQTSAIAAEALMNNAG